MPHITAIAVNVADAIRIAVNINNRMRILGRQHSINATDGIFNSESTSSPKKRYVITSTAIIDKIDKTIIAGAQK